MNIAEQNCYRTEEPERGVAVKPVDLRGPLDAIKQLLIGIDMVISALILIQYAPEINLITASKEADAGRYVPSFFGPCCPPRGVMYIRDKKEDMLDHIKRLYAPYTVIDVGWWYQLSVVSLPSGKIRANDLISTTQIISDGRAPWALTDDRDIGGYAARIIADPRTLNKSVLAYGEVWCQNDVFDAIERIAGEPVPREHVSAEDLQRDIDEAQATFAGGQVVLLESVEGKPAMLKYGMAQYKHTQGIRGDNTPEHAKYLGYLDVKELYPDVKVTTLESCIRDMTEGKVKVPWE
ncbi:NAD(P)-binding protein [Camillea tinctor]|nr:NAD(P)-binding protein [Camillea tinctor]